MLLHQADCQSLDEARRRAVARHRKSTLVWSARANGTRSRNWPKVDNVTRRKGADERCCCAGRNIIGWRAHRHGVARHRKSTLVRSAQANGTRSRNWPMVDNVMKWAVLLHRTKHHWMARAGMLLHRAECQLDMVCAEASWRRRRDFY